MGVNRKRITEELALKSWEEVDLTLKEIAECEMTVEGLEASMNLKMQDIVLETEMAAKPFVDRIGKLELDLKAFVDEHKAELGGKTKQLNFGKTGYRLSTKVMLKKVENVLKALEQHKMDDCIIVKKTVNKEVLRRYGEDDILKVGATLKKEDVFWYETERETLKETK